MDKLKINLIPPEIKEKVKKQAKRVLITKISVALLGVLIVITSLILGGVIFQKAQLQGLNSIIEQEKQQIGALKDKEAVVIFLKNRIDTINQVTDGHYKQDETLELITGLFPDGVNLGSLQIDKSSIAIVSGDTFDTLLLQQLFDNLTDPQTNDGKIASISVESLNKNASGKIRFDLQINLLGVKK